MPDAALRRGRFRYRLGWQLRKHYVTWLALVRARKEFRHLLVRSSSEILIDGYYRSANTFAVEAFRSVNPTVTVLDHLHSPFQFIRSARFGVPAILLIRQPEDAVASELVRSSERSAEEALEEWIFFYKTSRSVMETSVVATFDQVTEDFSQVIQRANDSFDRRFAPYHNSPLADADAFCAVDQYFRAGRGIQFSDEKFSRVVGRPNPARGEELRQARARVTDLPGTALSEARALYSEFLAAAEERPQRPQFGKSGT